MVTKEEKEYKNILYVRIYVDKFEAVKIKIGMTTRSYSERSKEYMPIEPYWDSVSRVDTDKSLEESENKLRRDFELFVVSCGGNKISGKVDWFEIPRALAETQAQEDIPPHMMLKIICGFAIGYFSGLEAAFCGNKENFFIYPRMDEIKKFDVIQLVEPEGITVEDIVNRLNVDLEPINDMVAEMAVRIGQQGATIEEMQRFDANGKI